MLSTKTFSCLPFVEAMEEIGLRGIDCLQWQAFDHNVGQ